MSRILRATASVALLSVLGGCGYTLQGRGINVDPSIKRIGVPVFRDDTGKPGLDQKITQKVVEELLHRGHFEVVSTTTGVDAIVEGEILSYRAQPTAFNPIPGAAPGNAPQASRYTIMVSAKVRYYKPGSDTAIWENDAFPAQDDYEFGTDPNSFAGREDQALVRLATTFARTLVSSMLEGF
jgi:hypothetical protein